MKFMFRLCINATLVVSFENDDSVQCHRKENIVHKIVKQLTGRRVAVAVSFLLRHLENKAI